VSKENIPPDVMSALTGGHTIKDNTFTDQKITQANKKPRLASIPLRALMGVARVFGYGAKKYAKGNFINATVADGAIERYFDATERHLAGMQNIDGTFDVESVAHLDEESGLPHFDHLLCSLIMLRAVLIKEDVLPLDPGEGNEPPPKK